MTISHGGKPLQRTAVLNEVRQPHKSLKDAFQWIFEAIEKEPVLAIALAAMLITCIFVPVDAEYLGYFNWPTLATLYCTLGKSCNYKDSMRLPAPPTGIYP